MKEKIDCTSLCDSGIKTVFINTGEYIDDECSATGYPCEYESVNVPSEFMFGDEGEEGGGPETVIQCKYCGKVKD